MKMNSYRQPGGGGSHQSIAMLQPSRSSYLSYAPMIYTVRPSNKVSYQSQQGKVNIGRQPYGGGGGKMNEVRWSFGAPYYPPGSFQQRPQKPAAYANASFNGGGEMAARNTTSIRVAQYQQQRGGGGNTNTNLQPPAYIAPPSPSARGSSSLVASNGQAMHQSRPQQVRNANSNSDSRARAYAYSNTGPNVNGMKPVAATASTAPSDQQLPPEGENVKYVQLNWEDILGGKDRLNSLRVTMAPATKDNPNRQLNIGFGSSADGSVSDGSVPLKVIKFEPLQNYPGQVISSTPASASGAASSASNLPSLSPQTSLANMTAMPTVASPASATNFNYTHPQMQPQARMQMKTAQQGQPPQYMNYVNANNGASSDLQMQQLMSRISIQESPDGQPMITLPPGYKLASLGQMNMNMTSGSASNDNAYGNSQFQHSQASKQCSCPACQNRQPVQTQGMTRR